MLRKLFKTGNSTVISFPKEYLEALHIEAGSEVHIDLDRESNTLTITPVHEPAELAGIDETFARQVSEFIAEYRTALEELAKNS